MNRRFFFRARQETSLLNDLGNTLFLPVGHHVDPLDFWDFAHGLDGQGG